MSDIHEKSTGKFQFSFFSKESEFYLILYRKNDMSGYTCWGSFGPKCYGPSKDKPTVNDMKEFQGKALNFASTDGSTWVCVEDATVKVPFCLSMLLSDGVQAFENPNATCECCGTKVNEEAEAAHS